LGGLAFRITTAVRIITACSEYDGVVASLRASSPLISSETFLNVVYQMDQFHALLEAMLSMKALLLQRRVVSDGRSPSNKSLLVWE
jgi:hypothetical protein